MKNKHDKDVAKLLKALPKRLHPALIRVVKKARAAGYREATVTTHNLFSNLSGKEREYDEED